VFVGFDGSVMRGREQIASVHQELFDRWLKGSSLVDEGTEVRFLGADVAIVHAIGGTLMRGKAESAPERDSIQTLVAARHDGAWSFVSFQNTRIRPIGIGASLARARQALAAPLPPHEDRAAEEGRARRRVTGAARHRHSHRPVAGLTTATASSPRPPATCGSWRAGSRQRRSLSFDREGGSMSTDNANNDRPILVLGARGKTGRRVASRLRERGIAVRAGSRSGVPGFDWERPESWAPALDGVRAAYVSYYPDLAVPGAVEVVGAFAELGVKRGVGRLVLLAGRGEPEAEDAEAAVRDSRAELTVVRATWFAQNFSEDHMLDGVLSGVVALPAGETPEPFVDAEDIADVVVEALTDDRHVGELYELTGPRLRTFAQAVEEISRAAGRDIRYVPVSAADYATAASEDGVPAEVVELVTYLFMTVLDGRNAHLADGVERALGRAPRDFGEYARRTAATGVWDA
jgi:uncharacterized protein (TIGR02246 family)